MGVALLLHEKIRKRKYCRSQGGATRLVASQPLPGGISGPDPPNYRKVSQNA